MQRQGSEMALPFSLYFLSVIATFQSYLGMMTRSNRESQIFCLSLPG
jgi:hypothetical protein